ncbi:MAG: hypothetical protein ABH883_07825, partial [Candidatus Omnitrophota bacterium]
GLKITFARGKIKDNGEISLLPSDDTVRALLKRNVDVERTADGKVTVTGIASALKAVRYPARDLEALYIWKNMEKIIRGSLTARILEPVMAEIKEKNLKEYSLEITEKMEGVLRVDREKGKIEISAEFAESAARLAAESGDKYDALRKAVTWIMGENIARCFKLEKDFQGCYEFELKHKALITAFSDNGEFADLRGNTPESAGAFNRVLTDLENMAVLRVAEKGMIDADGKAVIIAEKGIKEDDVSPYIWALNEILPLVIKANPVLAGKKGDTRVMLLKGPAQSAAAYRLISRYDGNLYVDIAFLEKIAGFMGESEGENIKEVCEAGAWLLGHDIRACFSDEKHRGHLVLPSACDIENDMPKPRVSVEKIANTVMDIQKFILKGKDTRDKFISFIDREWLTYDRFPVVIIKACSDSFNAYSGKNREELAKVYKDWEKEELDYCLPFEDIIAGIGSEESVDNGTVAQIISFMFLGEIVRRMTEYYDIGLAEYGSRKMLFMEVFRVYMDIRNNDRSHMLEAIKQDLADTAYKITLNEQYAHNLLKSNIDLEKLRKDLADRVNLIGRMDLDLRFESEKVQQLITVGDIIRKKAIVNGFGIGVSINLLYFSESDLENRVKELARLGYVKGDITNEMFSAFIWGDKVTFFRGYVSKKYGVSLSQEQAGDFILPETDLGKAREDFEEKVKVLTEVRLDLNDDIGKILLSQASNLRKSLDVLKNKGVTRDPLFLIYNSANLEKNISRLLDFGWTKEEITVDLYKKFISGELVSGEREKTVDMIGMSDLPREAVLKDGSTRFYIKKSLFLKNFDNGEELWPDLKEKKWITGEREENGEKTADINEIDREELDSRFSALKERIEKVFREEACFVSLSPEEMEKLNAWT